MQIQIKDIETKSNVVNYIEKITSPDNETSLTRRIVRGTLEVLSLTAVAGARVGIVVICMTGAGKILNLPSDHPLSLVVGGSNAAGCLVTFGAMSVFTMLRVIQEITREVTDEEKVLVLDDIPLWKKSIFKVISVVGGLTAQVPVAYATYKSAPFAPTMLGIFAFLDFGKAAYSIEQSLLGAFSAKSPTYEGFEEVLINNRNSLKNYIDNYRRALADENTDHQSIMEGQLRAFAQNPEEGLLLNSQIYSGTRHQSLLQNVLNENVPHIPTKPPLNTWCSYFLDFISLGISATVLAKFWQLGAEASELLTHGRPKIEQDVVHYIGAFFVVMANAYLWFSLIKNSTHLMANVVREATLPTITQKLHGRVHKVFTVVGIVAAYFTFVPQFYFAKMTFPGKAYYPIGTISTIGAILGGANATFALRDILIEKFTRNKECQKLLELDNLLKSISAVVSKVQPKEYAKFLKSLDDETRAKLNSPSIEELNQYLDASI